MYIFLVTSQVRRLKVRQIQLIILLYDQRIYESFVFQALQ